MVIKEFEFLSKELEYPPSSRKEVLELLPKRIPKDNSLIVDALFKLCNKD